MNNSLASLHNELSSTHTLVLTFCWHSTIVTIMYSTARTIKINAIKENGWTGVADVTLPASISLTAGCQQLSLFPTSVSPFHKPFCTPPWFAGADRCCGTSEAWGRCLRPYLRQIRGVSSEHLRMWLVIFLFPSCFLKNWKTDNMK